MIIERNISRLSLSWIVISIMPSISLTTLISIGFLATNRAFASTSKNVNTENVANSKRLKSPIGVLTLTDYLAQVSKQHMGLRAADQNAMAARSYSSEAKTLLAPTLLANGAGTSEGQSNPLSPGGRYSTQSYSLGVTQATPIGLNAKLAYNYSSISIPSLPSYNSGYTQIDLSQSLLRNFAGAEIKMQVQAGEAAALAKSYSQAHVSQALLIEAEQSYWRLALARELVQMHNDSVERAQKLFEWTSRRTKLQLTDRAENLQASTNLQARKIDLRAAQDDERAASLAFNASRSQPSNVVHDRLMELTPDLVLRMSLPETHGRRNDAIAATFLAQASEANALLSREKNKPTLEIFGSALITEPNTPAAALASLIPVSSRPASSIGIRMTAPLNLETLKQTREGYAAEAQAADWNLQRKLFEEERDWRDLSAKFKESKERFKLYVDLEKTQREKLYHERDRQSRGRSTLQQVLFFESDFELAQLGRIRTLAELLNLNAQLKIYGASNESR